MRITLLTASLILLSGLLPIPSAAEPLESKKISIDFQDTEIENALRVIAEAAQVNIVLIDGVHLQVTKQMNDTPWPKVLKTLLGEHGLQSRKDGDVLRVFDPKNPKGSATVPDAYKGRLASFDFDDQAAADVEKILRAVAQQAVTIPRKEGCRISFRLYDIPWDQAADIAAQICTRRRG